MDKLLDWCRYQWRKLLRPRVIVNGGVRIDLGPAAQGRYARSFYRDSHERDEREIVALHLDADDTVLELGAGLGMVTILCAQRIGSERVHAFEANRALEPALRRNFELNGVAPRLTMQMATLDGGDREFFVADRFVLSSGHPDAARSGGFRRTVTRSASLIEILRQLQPTFLIADIEGGELDLADPATPLDSVRKICVEVHPQIIGDAGVSRLTAALIGRGFDLRLPDCRGNVLYFARPAAAGAAGDDVDGCSDNDEQSDADERRDADRRSNTDQRSDAEGRAPRSARAA